MLKMKKKKKCNAVYCIALHCTKLHCTILYITALQFTALHCTGLHCNINNLYCLECDKRRIKLEDIFSLRSYRIALYSYQGRRLMDYLVYWCSGALFKSFVILFNRPGVAGGVLQTALSLINKLSQSLSPPFWKYL